MFELRKADHIRWHVAFKEPGTPPEKPNHMWQKLVAWRVCVMH